MSLKIDVSDIVKDHWRTLADKRTGKTSSVDVLLFGGLPLAVAGLLVGFEVGLSKDATNTAITAVAILAGLLFNLLLLTHSLLRRGDTEQRQIERALLREIYVNIAFCIVAALICMAALLVRMLVARDAAIAAATFVSYAMLSLVFLTLLMILKRIHVMLAKEFGS